MNAQPLVIQTGGNVGIGGFIITGTDPKKVLIRAIGPTLGRFGILNALQDPVLELHDGKERFLLLTTIGKFPNKLPSKQTSCAA